MFSIIVHAHFIHIRAFEIPRYKILTLFQISLLQINFPDAFYSYLNWLA